MLPKEKRLRKVGDFKRVYSKGSFFYQRSFNVNFLIKRQQLTRVGIVVEKKISKKAVLRNSLKRKFRESVRNLYGSLPKGYDVIINIKKEAFSASQKELESEIQRAFQRIGKNEKTDPRGNKDISKNNIS